MNNPERVRVWNTFFKLAWTEAKHIFEEKRQCSSSTTFAPLGGTLPDDQLHIVGALVLCCLSIEARANHLIDEFQEDGVITPEVAEAARWLPTRQKWFFLPTLAGVPNTLNASLGPHQAVAQLCDLRNNLMHVRYEQMIKKLPTPEQMLSFFERFVEAMEDMNVMLKPHPAHDPDILKIGKFQVT